MPKELHINVRIEGGSLWATVEEFPGVFAAGDTAEDLRASLEEGISLYLAQPGKEAPTVRLDALQTGPMVANAHLAYA
jgi:predicted RNase H-like HicB family nuclease